MQEKALEPVTDGQMDALKRFIGHSGDAGELTKNALCWLLAQTQNLSSPVYCCIPIKYGASIILKHIDAMCKFKGSTVLPLFLQGMGTQMKISFQDGMYEPVGHCHESPEKEFNVRLRGITIWIAPFIHNNGDSKEVVFDRKEVERSG